MLRRYAAPLCALPVLLLLGAVCSVVSEEDKQAVRAQNYAAQHPGEDAKTAAPGLRRLAELRVGNCVDMNPAASEFEDVKVVDCTSSSATARVTELSFIVTNDDRYPGEQWFESFGPSRCAIDANDVIYPTQTVWDVGSRVVICMQDR